MAAPALTTAASSLALLALGSAANLSASAQPLPIAASEAPTKTWLRRGGFIGTINGRGPAPAPSPAPAAPAAPAANKKIHPIGGKTDQPMPPSPFGKFPRHRPSKLPGPPKSFDPAKGP